MLKYEYVSKKEYMPIKNEIISIIKKVQDAVCKSFTFRFDFVGSASRCMITRCVNSNVGYDFDVDIMVNNKNNLSPKEIKETLMKALNKFNNLYDNCEDSTRVITMKVKDKVNSKILHSCDFAIVRDNSDGRKQYINNNKNQNSYSWEFQPKQYNQIQEKIKAIKENSLWQRVRDSYLKKKCNNTDLNKKSRSIFVETINEIFNNIKKEGDNNMSKGKGVSSNTHTQQQINHYANQHNPNNAAHTANNNNHANQCNPNNPNYQGHNSGKK